MQEDVINTLTQLQRLFLNGQKMQPESPLYNMAFRFDLYGELDVARFRAAFEKLVELNDCLRMKLDFRGEAIIEDHVDFNLPLMDGDPTAVMQALVRQPLDLTARFFDSRLYKVDQNHYVWYLNQHHLITDAAASTLLFEQLGKLYLDQEVQPAATLQQRLNNEYAVKNSEDFLKAQKYWEKKISLATCQRASNTIPNRTSRTTRELSCETMRLLEEKKTILGIRSFSEDLTFFSVLAAALFILRYRLFSIDENTLGFPFHNRSSEKFLGPEFEIGFLACDIAKCESFIDVVTVVRNETILSLKHCLPGTTTAIINNSFSWLINYLTASFGTFAGMDCRSEWIHPEAGDIAHGLRLQVHDFNQIGRLTLHFDCADALFTRVQQKQLPVVFERLLKKCLLQPDADFRTHYLPSDNEFKILEKFNSTTHTWPGTSIIEQIIHNSNIHPNRIAIKCDEGDISYAQLDQLSSALAIDLMALDVIPVLCSSGRDAVIAFVAALKSGKAFIPLDTSHPDGRLNNILDQLGNPIVVCTKDQICRELHCAGTVSVPFDLQESRPYQFQNRDNTAYIIFTSGTSGQPKGVEVGHHSFSNYLNWAAKTYCSNLVTNMPLFSSLAFDLTLTSVFLPLLTGGCVVAYTSDQKSSALSVLDVVDDDLVDIIKLTPSHLRLLLGSGKQQTLKTRSKLKALILGGEGLPRSLAEEAKAFFEEGICIYNEYGPTEATIGCMIHKYDPFMDLESSVPIGRPIYNSKIHLLDNCRQFLPFGFDGQIHIAGEVLALKYFDAKSIAGEVYATGDRAYQLMDGTMVYLGRQGTQVKFRGARIELEEIENVIKSTNLVDQAFVHVYSKKQAPEAHCQRCGISSRVPGIEIDSDNLCSPCKDFDGKSSAFKNYFRDLGQLEKELAERSQTTAENRTMVLASGGKDSSYVLCKMVEMGFLPIVFTLDNGYLSQHALENVERLCKRFDLKWVRECPSSMKTIFADSLKRHSNVCEGCFKALYTLAINYAKRHKVSSIVTGLSRGQLFETRLMDMVADNTFDQGTIDYYIDSARIAYHQIDDAVSETLDVTEVRNPLTFEQVKFFDFYRYCDVSLSTILEFITDFGGWKRPPDTGRSTNCLINDVGIHVHNLERRFHNYAIPYAWDVRLGHKTRKQAIEELNDEIDVLRVEAILKELDYQTKPSQEQTDEQLVAYYTKKSGPENLQEKLKQTLQNHLPVHALPSALIELEALPLTPSGKIDFSALPSPQEETGNFQAPTNEIEHKLVALWRHFLSSQEIGISDNFFQLGGDSISAVQICARGAEQGLLISATDIFANPTVKLLALKTKLKQQNPSDGKFYPDSGLESTELHSLLSSLTSKKRVDSK